MKKSVAPKNLITKLAEACNAVGGVEKKGRNEHQKYAYVKAADVAKAIRHELFQRKVLLLADEKEITEANFTTSGGTVMRQLTLKVEYALLDGESEQKIVTTAYGIAMDSGDKALYKAKTGALKYFLRGLGIIPDEKDDPEFDESVDEQTDPRVFEDGFDKRTKGQRKIAEYQQRAFDAATHKSGKTAEQIASYLRERFKVATVTDLMKADFNEAIRWANGLADLASTLELSKQAAERKKANGAEAESERSEAAGD